MDEVMESRSAEIKGSVPARAVMAARLFRQRGTKCILSEESAHTAVYSLLPALCKLSNLHMKFGLVVIL
jgi:hypothetical protein